MAVVVVVVVVAVCFYDQSFAFSSKNLVEIMLWTI